MSQLKSISESLLFSVFPAILAVFFHQNSLSPKSDYEAYQENGKALAGDWQVVGNDLRTAMDGYVQQQQQTK